MYLTEEKYKIAEENGISRKVVFRRVVENGWDITRAITEPVNTKHHPTGAWERWQHVAVVSYQNFRTRLSRGWSEKDAALTPALKPRGAYVRNKEFSYMYAAVESEVLVYASTH